MSGLVLVRRWLRVASMSQRVSTGFAAVAVCALLALALVPARPGDRANDIVVGPTDGDAGAVDDVSPGRDQLSGMTASTAPPDLENGLPAPGTAAGHVSEDGVSTPPTGVEGSSPPTSIPLTATDRGVSAEAITVGFSFANFAGALDAGIVTKLRSDVREVIDALVAYANEAGGVLGRRIDPVVVSADLTNTDDQRQKCLELTETNRSFAVVDAFSFSSETATSCVTAEHKTLLLTGVPGSSANVARGAPYLVSIQKDDNRKMKDLATAAVETGFLDDEQFVKLGILQDACEPSIYDSPTDGLHRYLRDAGVKEWSQFRLACGSDSADGSRPEAAVLRFRQDGVSHVLLAAHPPMVRDYLTAAGYARFRPEYLAGDYLNLVLNGLVQDYEPTGFDGAIAVTQTRAGETTLGMPIPELAQKCSKIFTDHGVAPVTADGNDDLADEIEVLEICESFLLFLDVAARAGPDLTRHTWLAALARTGDFRAASSDIARFDRPGKQTGGDTTKLVQWHADCRCWKQLTGFRPAAG